ncbi:hypothetical protein [Actinomadura madurae]|uniref:hypothetical protein n=1 Tax=Actinomadura madurae TaxID=1993 RepID=UPI000D93CAFF|nr:hypothetical protein [Actinomadura madurae]SPT58086.1 Uncharacterised protein [Actinomadura madurae]
MLWRLDLVLVSVCAIGLVPAIGAPLWTRLVPDLAIRVDRWVLADRHTAWATGASRLTYGNSPPRNGWSEAISRNFAGER